MSARADTESARDAHSISVVIPAYNSEALLTEAIASVYDQTIEPSEVIVVNDGSTDGTEALLERLAPALPPTFRWFSKPNGGSASARNAGLKFATGRLLAFLDHDDRWLPEKLVRQLDQFIADPELMLSFTAMNVVRYERAADGSLIRGPEDRATPRSSRTRRHGVAEISPASLPPNWNSTQESLLRTLVSQEALIGSLSSVMVRREVFEVVGMFNEELSVTDDFLMWLKMAAAGMKFEYMPEPMVEYRMHEGNLHGDRPALWNDLASVYDEFLAKGGLSRQMLKRIRLRRWCAHWHLLTAIQEQQEGNSTRARHHVLRAARVHPPSIRPGWIRILGIGSPPDPFPRRASWR